MLDQWNNLSCYFEAEYHLWSVFIPFYSFFKSFFFCNCSKRFISSSFDKVTTGTYNYVSVILNSAPDAATIAGLAAASVVISAKTQFLDQVKINSTPQLISGIFKLLEKLLKCFCRTTSFNSLMNHYFPVFFLQYLFYI